MNRSPNPSRRSCPRLLIAALVLGTTAAHAQPGALTQSPALDACVSNTGAGPCIDGYALQNAMSAAISPDGKFVYVGASASRGLAAFSRNRTSGTLTQLGFPAGCVTESGDSGVCKDGSHITTIRAMAFSPDGRNMYAAAQFSSAVAIFDRDRRTGELTQKPALAGCIAEDGSDGLCTDGRGLAEAFGVTVSQDGKNVYVLGNVSASVAVFARDRSTGELTQLPGTAGCISETGSNGQCADGRALNGATNLVLSEDGRFAYVTAAGSSAVAIFSRDKTTGALTQLPGAAGCISEQVLDGTCASGHGLDGAAGIALSNDGRNLYTAGARTGGNAVAVFTRDRSSGVLTQLPGTLGCISEDTSDGQCADGKALDGAFSVVVSHDDKQVYVASIGSDAVAILRRDRKTGALTQSLLRDGCISEFGSDGQCTEGRGLNNAIQLVASPDGRHVYVAAVWNGDVAVLQREK